MVSSCELGEIVIVLSNDEMKLPIPIFVTESGITIEVSKVVFIKAKPVMFVNVGGSTIEVSILLLWKGPLAWFVVVSLSPNPNWVTFGANSAQSANVIVVFLSQPKAITFFLSKTVPSKIFDDLQLILSHWSWVNPYKGAVELFCSFEDIEILGPSREVVSLKESIAIVVTESGM